MNSEKYLVRAFGKVNLFLDITGKRPDGYHDILTLFMSVALNDEIILSESDETSLKITDKTIPLDKTNTVLKALCLFHEAALVKGVKTSDFEVEVRKRIPVGAGMGGGSADGAAVLRFLNNRYGNLFTDKELEEIAVRVGSDVPFLLKGGLAKGEGLGEKLEYFDFPELESCKLVILYPNVHISTKWAYENYSKHLTKSKKYYNINSLKKDFDEFKGSLKFSFNVFEDLVYGTYPRLREIRERLEAKSPLLSMMTGSGSAIFALFEGSADLSSIEKEFGGNKLILTTPITQRHINNEFLTKL